MNTNDFIAILVSALLFGSVHAITALYAVIATFAGIYFGYLQVANDHTLVVPMIAHGLYDFLALLYAHYVVSNMSTQRQQEILEVDLN